MSEHVKPHGPRCRYLMSIGLSLFRFDFVLDSKLNLYLMEANMSPNLSTGHFTLNRLLYEQV